MGPLISVQRLLDLLEGAAVTVADCRWYLDDPAQGLAAYERGHIPGAGYWLLEEDLSAAEGPGRHPLPDPQAWSRRVAARGVSSNTPVVAYDDGGGAIAARLWWMLRALGHRHVAVLDGGIQAWTDAGHDVTTIVQEAATGDFTTTATDWPGTIDREELANRLGQLQVIDARDPERYRGEYEPIDPVAGHIPTAINAPYVDNLDSGGRLLAAAALAARYRALGVGAPRDTVVYCGSGVTACHNILAMEVSGLGPATLYPGSWSDWSASGGEVASGAPSPRSD